MNATRKRPLLLIVLLAAALSASACNTYYTIGAGPEGVQVPGSNVQPTKPKSSLPHLAVIPTPTKDTTVYCRLADLTPAATWAPEGDALAGSLTLANYWDVPCTLRGQPELALTDDNGVDFDIIVTAPTPTSPLQTWLFKPNTVGEMRFTWSSWCNDVHGTMRVAVTMAGQGQAVLYVPVRDAQGNPSSAAPPCNPQAGGKSTLTVEGLSIVK